MPGYPSLTAGAFTDANISALQQAIAGAGMLFTGNKIFLDPANTFSGASDTNDGLSPQSACLTLAGAYNKLRSGYNDVVVLMGNGSTSSTARLSAAFTWAKSAAHLIGVCPPSLVSPRARIAPTAGASAFANFFTVSGNGCYFANLQIYQGFTTGTTSEIALTVSGVHNVFEGVHIAGMQETAGANSTGSRNLKVSGDENRFVRCVIGTDTVARTAANYSLEISGGAARNIFDDCIFPAYVTGGGTAALFFYTAGSSSIDRWTRFNRCSFYNASTFSGGAAMAAWGTIGAASGGLVILEYCESTGVTALYSDATTQAQIRMAGPVMAQVMTMATPS